MERYPIQDLSTSQPVLGRIVRGFRDPAVTAYPRVLDLVSRKPVESTQTTEAISEQEIPGVAGSGRRGKEVRDKMEQEKNEKFHRMGDGNADPNGIAQLQQLVGGGGQAQQPAQQPTPAIPNQMGWR